MIVPWAMALALEAVSPSIDPLVERPQEPGRQYRKRPIVLQPSFRSVVSRPVTF